MNIEQLIADAKRYRWLRDSGQAVLTLADEDTGYRYAKAEFDIAIDEYMASSTLDNQQPAGQE